MRRYGSFLIGANFFGPLARQEINWSFQRGEGRGIGKESYERLPQQCLEVNTKVRLTKLDVQIFCTNIISAFTT